MCMCRRGVQEWWFRQLRRAGQRHRCPGPRLSQPFHSPARPCARRTRSKDVGEDEEAVLRGRHVKLQSNGVVPASRVPQFLGARRGMHRSVATGGWGVGSKCTCEPSAGGGMHAFCWVRGHVCASVTRAQQQGLCATNPGCPTHRLGGNISRHDMACPASLSTRTLCTAAFSAVEHTCVDAARRLPARRTRAYTLTFGTGG